MAEVGDLTLFQAVKKRLNWLAQRQEVLSQNIANADTPKYRASDLRPYDFKELLRREGAQLNMVATGSNHLPGRQKRIRDFAAEQGKPFETAPAGNNVVLEEQMAKVGETGTSYKMTTGLYKKHLAMLRMALGGGK
ncbi:MAG: flagellar basal body rod protein FlgB [Rhodospirillaceae bacterium]